MGKLYDIFVAWWWEPREEVVEFPHKTDGSLNEVEPPHHSLAGLDGEEKSEILDHLTYFQDKEKPSFATQAPYIWNLPTVWDIPKPKLKPKKKIKKPAKKNAKKTSRKRN